MDQVKIGKFIAQCRNEKNITQEELGEKLGVTNKTTSRWENRHYLPDIEMMQLLSKEFSISINELISGEKIKDLDYKEKAEENLINLSKFNHYESVTKGTVFLLIVATILIIYSLIRDIECFGYSTLLFGFSAMVYYNKYKQNNDRKLLLYFGCMIVAFVFSFIAFIVSTI